MKIGCEFDGNRLLELLETFFDNSDDCTHYFPGNGCQLPLIPGHYLAPYKNNKIYFSFSVPKVIKLLLQFVKDLINGSYETQICLIGKVDGEYKNISWKWVIEIDI